MDAIFVSLLQKGSGDHPAAEAARRFLASRQAFDAALVAFSSSAGAEPEVGSITDLIERMNGIEAEKARIADWTRWVGVRGRAVSHGLGPLIEALEDGRIDDAAEAFRIAYFTWWLPHALDESPVLCGFLHWGQSERVAQFRKLGDKAQELAAAEVRRAVAHELPPRDIVPRKSELGVLRHQLGLQRPSTPIRTLIAQMPTTFTRLTPCVLMSPLSIAQYLPPDHATFDMVIFDEASQITVDSGELVNRPVTVDMINHCAMDLRSRCSSTLISVRPMR
jgi:hypothetical protein